MCRRNHPRDGLVEKMLNSSDPARKRRLLEKLLECGRCDAKIQGAGNGPCACLLRHESELKNTVCRYLRTGLPDCVSVRGGRPEKKK